MDVLWCLFWISRKLNTYTHKNRLIYPDSASETSYYTNDSNNTYQTPSLLLAIGSFFSLLWQELLPQIPSQCSLYVFPILFLLLHNIFFLQILYFANSVSLHIHFTQTFVLIIFCRDYSQGLIIHWFKNNFI